MTPNDPQFVGCAKIYQDMFKQCLIMFKLSTNQVAFLLMENGASVDIVDSAGRSALFHAVISGEEAAIEAVIRRGGRLGLGNIGHVWP